MLSYLWFRFVYKFCIQCGIEIDAKYIVWPQDTSRPIVSKAIFMDKIIVDHTRRVCACERERASARLRTWSINQ